MSIEKKVKVVINADDLGYSSGINEGIIESIENGILTSTSLMVYRQATQEAVNLIRGREDVSIGLHLDLEKKGITGWAGVFSILTWSEQKIRTELERQVYKFAEVMGCLPDHIDSHLHFHRLTGFWPIVLEFSGENDIPVRSADAVLNTSFYNKKLSRITPNSLIDTLTKLSPGTHEIMCHPGYPDTNLEESNTNYLEHRQKELEALTSQEVRDFLNKQDQLELITWKQIKKKP